MAGKSSIIPRHIYLSALCSIALLSFAVYLYFTGKSGIPVIILASIAALLVTPLFMFCLYRRNSAGEIEKRNAQLYEVQDLFLSFMDNMPGLVHVKDTGGRYTYLNNKFLHTFDKQLIDLLGKTVFDLHPKEIADKLHENDNLVLKSGKVLEFEETVLLNGESRIFLTQKFPIYKDDKVDSIAGISMDITDRKNIEIDRMAALEALKSNENKYRLLFENSPAGIITLDSKGNILDVNESSLKILGSPSKDATKAINVLRFELLVKAGISAFVESCFSQNNSGSKEFEYTTKWGKHIYAIFSLKPNKDHSGNISDWQLIIQDISSVKSAELNLGKNLIFIRSIMDNAPVAIFFKNKELKYTSYNKVYADWTGRGMEEMIGLTVFDVAPKEAAVLFDQADKYLLAHGGTREFESYTENVITHERRDVLFRKTVITNPDGSIEGIVGILVDITERKKHDEERDRTRMQLLQASKLAALGKMAAGIAHELNNPMTVILGNSQLLIATEGAPEETISSAKEIEQSAQRCKHIISDMLEFSRMKETELSEASIHDIIDNALRMTSYQSEFKNIRVNKHFECTIPSIRCNISKIEQVFINLLTNASQAMPKGGDITISTACDPNSYSVAVSVTDSGTGIPHDDISNIFDPFYTTKEKGTGLGLAISLNIVQLHGGFITVDSPGEGKGSTFTVVLPKIPPEHPEKQ